MSKLSVVHVVFSLASAVRRVAVHFGSIRSVKVQFGTLKRHSVHSVPLESASRKVDAIRKSH